MKTRTALHCDDDGVSLLFTKKYFLSLQNACVQFSGVKFINLKNNTVSEFIN